MHPSASGSPSTKPNTFIPSRSAFGQLDPRILRMVQWATVIFSVLPVGALWLVHHRFLPSHNYHEWAFYVTAIGLPCFGILQLVWMPFTEAKARFYIIAFHILAIIGFMFVTSYDTIFIFMWLLLIMATDAFLGKRATYLSMGAFLGSMAVWWLLNLHTVPGAGLVFFLLSILAIFICVVALVVSRIRIISEDRGIEVEESREHERLESERLIALINSMGDAVIAVNDDGEINVYNAAAASLLDTNISLTGKKINDVLHLVDAQGKPVDLTQLLIEIKVNLVRTNVSHQFDDGEKINLYLNVSPIHRGFQNPGERGYIFLLRDITKEKTLEQERDEFISTASHELRTPVAIAEGSLSNIMVLKDRGVNQSVIDQAVTSAHDQVVLLARLVNDLATLSRTERQAEDIEIESVDIAALLRRLQDGYSDQAARKNLNLSTEAKGTLTPIKTSRLYLEEIVQNLVTNAIKYTKQGTIHVTAEMDERGSVILCVQDSGIGISKSDQKHLFERFWRSEDYRTRENSGTGLGLYLIQKLVGQLGGTITFDSQLDQGTTFTVTVPPFSDQTPRHKHSDNKKSGLHQQIAHNPKKEHHAS
ncbi:MAG TPA: ATP-binding protein [Patescibacteria group bacterium]|nr:ATP-binding protein [Patescibacteria group bacterium]